MDKKKFIDKNMKNINKEKLFKILGLIFSILTFIGAGIVIFNRNISVELAIIPSLFSAIFSNLSLKERAKNKDK